MKILPLYLPFEGCAHQCVYCNQPLTVGRAKDRPNWDARLRQLQLKNEEWEIAFYGGTFSALPNEEMQRCFDVARPSCSDATVSGFRISTRPDSVSDETLSFLKQNGVETIELGVESLDDFVLRKSGRGHSAVDVINAARRVKAHGFALGFHLMCGLPGQSRESWEGTALQAAALKPDLIRIAPTLVLKGTPLERLHLRGRYEPLALDEAIRQCAFGYREMHRRGIAIARVGLALSDDSGHGEEKLVAGPWHPALRHEVESHLVDQTIRQRLQNTRVEQIWIHPKDCSIVMGHKKKNQLSWKRIIEKEVQLRQDDNVPRHRYHIGDGRLRSLFYEDREPR